jgi:hypothetical protein
MGDDDHPILIKTQLSFWILFGTERFQYENHVKKWMSQNSHHHDEEGKGTDLWRWIKQLNRVAKLWLNFIRLPYTLKFEGNFVSRKFQGQNGHERGRNFKDSYLAGMLCSGLGPGRESQSRFKIVCLNAVEVPSQKWKTIENENCMIRGKWDGLIGLFHLQCQWILFIDSLFLFFQIH